MQEFWLLKSFTKGFHPFWNVLLVCTVALALTACGSDAPAVTDLPPPTPQAQQNIAPDMPDIVARVNGENITRAQYERAFNRMAQYSLTADDQILSENVLEMLIEQIVINQAAARLQVMVDDAEVQAELDRLRTSAGDEGAWQAWLNENGYTVEEMAQTIRDALITTRLREFVLAGDLPSATTPQNVLRVRARHILVETEAQARELLTRVQNGEDFAQLAAVFSRDVSTRDNGGDLGFFVREDLAFTPELAEIAFGLEVNQLAGAPVQTALGWHVIQVLGFEDAPAISGDAGAEQEFQFLEWLLEQRRSAVVERFIE